MIKSITSVHNPLVMHCTQLQLKPYRYEHAQFLAQGIRTCKTLFEKNSESLVYCFITQDFEDTGLFPKEKCVQVSDIVMKKINPSTTPSDILCIFSMSEPQPLPKNGPGLVCANITDPGNLGTLLRSAAAMNIQHVILIEGTDVYGPKVVQAATGAHAFLKLYQTSFETLFTSNLPLAALVVNEGTCVTAEALQEHFIVVGNEAHGLPIHYQEQCDKKVTIPMPGNTESLNAAVAGSIALYILSQKI